MKILFVCTGNTCRSPMAQAITNNLAKKQGLDISAKSAGTSAWSGADISPNAVTALKELYNIDALNHKSTTLTQALIKEADLIIGMSNAHLAQVIHICPDAKEKTKTLYDWAYADKSTDVADPFGGSLEIYVQCAQEIYNAISTALEQADKQ